MDKRLIKVPKKFFFKNYSLTIFYSYILKHLFIYLIFYLVVDTLI